MNLFSTLNKTFHLQFVNTAWMPIFSGIAAIGVCRFKTQFAKNISSNVNFSYSIKTIGGRTIGIY